jgi:molecular chaperone GrpE
MEIGHEDIVETDEEGTETVAQKKIKDLRKKLADAEKKSQEYLTGWQKDKAEFINARRRDDEAKAEYLKFASAKTIEDILPVLDSFDMAMGNKTLSENVPKEWKSGIESILQQLQTALGKHGVVSIGNVGDVFDPNLHHSIATVPADDKNPNGTIAEVLQKGYSLSGKVIRPALVKVFE